MTTIAFDPEDLDRLFLFFCACLIMFMQGGFAMLEAGCVPIVTVDLILFKNVMDLCVGCVLYWFLGYMLAFGGDFNENCANCNRFIGTENVFLIGLEDKHFIFFFFEFASAAACATILSGAIAGRMKWQGYMIVSGMISMFIYPVVCHWVWSEHGWLSITNNYSAAFGIGAMDFAGAGVVHTVGGMTSLVACKMLGYRNQYLTKDLNKSSSHAKLFVPRYENEGGKWKMNELKSYNTTFATLGLFILWFGWYGFNCGGAVIFNGKSGLIGRVAINTTLSGGVAAVTSVLIGRIQNREIRYYKYNLADLNNGVLAGLVAITGSCAFVEPWAAICIGIIAAFVYKGAGHLVSHPKLRIDDPLDAVPVHGFCGCLGIIMPGFFGRPSFLDDVAASPGRGGGIFYGYGANLGIQIIELLVIVAWAISWAVLLFSIIILIDTKFASGIFLIRGKQNEGIGFGVHDFFPKSNLHDTTASWHYFHDHKEDDEINGTEDEINGTTDDTELRDMN